VDEKIEKQMKKELNFGFKKRVLLFKDEGLKGIYKEREPKLMFE